MEKISILVKSRVKLKNHRQEELEYKGKWLNFFFIFLASVFFQYLSLSGIKKDKFMLKTDLLEHINLGFSNCGDAKKRKSF